MAATYAQSITILEATHEKLARLVMSLSDDALDYHSGPEEWSIREILAHLVDDEMFVLRTRLERLVKEEYPTLVPNDEKLWYRQRNTSRDAVSELLHDFAIQRAASLNILTFLREDEWMRTGYHPEEGDITTENLVEHWAEHDLVHVRQIEQIRAAYSEAL